MYFGDWDSKSADGLVCTESSSLSKNEIKFQLCYFYKAYKSPMELYSISCK